MYSFAEYRAFREFGEIIDKPTTGVTFDSDEAHDFVYNFEVGGQQFSVAFAQDYISYYSKTLMRSMNLSDDAYAITLSGPQGYDLTGAGNGTQVYGHLIMAVKKLISDERPEGLIFTGTNAQQRWMYASFYKRNLNKLYTQIGVGEYLSNDYIQRVTSSTSPNEKIKSTAIKEAMEEFGRSNYDSKLKEQKDFLRKHYLNLKANTGKIMLFSFHGVIDDHVDFCYLVSVNPAGAVVYKDGRYSENVANINELMPIPTTHFSFYKSQIESVQHNLRSLHQISNTQSWVVEGYKMPKFAMSAYNPDVEE
jgi:hypothetical protein